MALLPAWPSSCLTVRVTPEIMWVDHGLLVVASVALGTYPYGSRLWFSTAWPARSSLGSGGLSLSLPLSVRVCATPQCPATPGCFRDLCHPFLYTHTFSSLPVGIRYRSDLILGHGPGNLTPLRVGSIPW